MLKRSLALFILGVFLILVSGCGTITGAASGVYQGAKKDWVGAQNVWSKVKQADDWIRKNLW